MIRVVKSIIHIQEHAPVAAYPVPDTDTNPEA
jgi:hypothetical protein